jgi:hypothetical protein
MKHALPLALALALAGCADPDPFPAFTVHVDLDDARFAKHTIAEALGAAAVPGHALDEFDAACVPAASADRTARGCFVYLDGATVAYVRFEHTDAEPMSPAALAAEGR